MKNKVIFEVQGYCENREQFSSFENVLGLIDLYYSSPYYGIGRKNNNIFSQSKDSNLIGMIWVEKGNCTLLLNDMPYVLHKHSFFLVPPLDSLCFDTLSHDFKAKMLIMEKTFMDECISNKQILSFYNCLFVKRLLQTELNTEETTLFNICFEDLKEKIENRGHSFRKEMIEVSFKSFLLESTNILNNKEESKTFEQFTRKEEVFNKFMDLLLDNYKEQHEVAYYADKLYITPQYLTMIIKSLTGKTTNKWIDETLVLEARKLLKTTQRSVQQIADLLNFSDQSTFGKFFKKYHGVSPVEYRKLQYNPLAMAI